MKKLVIATQNLNKFKEMKDALGGLAWEIVPALDFPGFPEVIEDGQTLEENSLKKAESLSRFSGLSALADDTGLFVEALGGQPGVHSARFAGPNGNDIENVRKLLELLKDIPPDRRQAYFKTIITLFHPDRPFQQAAGEIKGFITKEQRGSNGFGYDPVFQPSGYDKVFAEMNLEEKNTISHRGIAIRYAKRLLEG
jgi:XTP/dITP diphosphohydrolase